MDFDTQAAGIRPTLIKLAKRYVPLADAEDLVQETLLSAWRHIGDFRAEASFLSWTAAILLNQCRSYWRKALAQRRPKLDFVGEYGDLMDPGPNQEQTCYTNEAVSLALGALPPRAHKYIAYNLSGDYAKLGAINVCKYRLRMASAIIGPVDRRAA